MICLGIELSKIAKHSFTPKKNKNKVNNDRVPISKTLLFSRVVWVRGPDKRANCEAFMNTNKKIKIR